MPTRRPASQTTIGETMPDLETATGRGMSAGTIGFGAVATIGVALLLLAQFGRRGAIGLAALALGAAGGVALAICGIMLMDGWAQQMEHFDFSAFEPTMNVGSKTDGRGPMFAVYLWPYEAVALGACATYAFSRELHRRLRSHNG